LYAIKRKKANWVGHILRRDCPLKQVIEVKIEGRRKGRKRPKQLLNACSLKHVVEKKRKKTGEENGGEVSSY